MKRYIVQNCPALTDQSECYQGSVFMGTAFKECQERSDCVMKRIVDECKETDKYYSFCLQKNRETNYKFQDEESMKWLMGRSHHADEILRLLEIEEVDE